MTSTDSLTPADFSDDDAEKIGKKLRDYGNPLVGVFAAELVGESYPFSAEMSKIVLCRFTDLELGKHFHKWMQENDD